MALVKVCSLQDETRLVVVRNLLDSAGIPYFIHNERFASLYVGPPVDLMNMKTVLVPEAYAEEARNLLQEIAGPASGATRPLSRFDRLRIALEALLFTWFVPGRRRSRNDRDQGQTQR